MTSKIIERINRLFPEAKPVDQVIENYYTRMRRECGLVAESTIAGLSVCPDELNNQVTERIRKLFGQPFHLGGLGGYPFSGESGFEIFGEHIPDGGDGMIFFGPHLGIDADQPLGYIRRRGQQHATPSCASMIKAYEAVTGASPVKRDNDHQQETVQQLLTDKLHLITDENPEIDLLNLLLEESYEFIVQQSRWIKGRFNPNGIVLLGAYIINTPSEMPDYLDVKYFETI